MIQSIFDIKINAFSTVVFQLKVKFVFIRKTSQDFHHHLTVKHLRGGIHAHNGACIGDSLLTFWYLLPRSHSVKNDFLQLFAFFTSLKVLKYFEFEYFLESTPSAWQLRPETGEISQFTQMFCFSNERYMLPLISKKEKWILQNMRQWEQVNFSSWALFRLIWNNQPEKCSTWKIMNNWKYELLK